ncbi:hypothetical protein [Vreelandella titanicae]|jgi:putative acetyltransferase|uniref:hypothetical protein n=1 Tax=Vreelandella titanicae TaxID=664683 RepID=UPI0039BF47DF
MIRVFEDQDFEAIEEIYTLAKLDEFRFERGPFELIPLRQDEERLRGLMESVIFVYADKGIRGYGAVYENEIRTLLVHPLFRRQGVGNQLFGLDRKTRYALRRKKQRGGKSALSAIWF